MLITLSEYCPYYTLFFSRRQWRVWRVWRERRERDSSIGQNASTPGRFLYAIYEKGGLRMSKPPFSDYYYGSEADQYTFYRDLGKTDTNNTDVINNNKYILNNQESCDRMILLFFTIKNHMI
jgi:hypothetical protein